MNANRIPSRVISVSAAITCAAFTFVAACSRTSAAKSDLPEASSALVAPEASRAPATAAPAKQPALADAPIAAFRTELLELAFRSATEIPLQPHARSRAREQEAVANACVELDQSARARSYLDQIGDWRRGAGYADLAYHCAMKGRAEFVPELLELAQGIANVAAKDAPSAPPAGEVDVSGAWQRDRIRSKIARAHFALGETAAAQPFATGLAGSEAGRVLAEQARATDAAAFDEQLSVLSTVVVKGSFDEVCGALDALVQLWTRFQGDAPRRARIEEQMSATWTKVPMLVGVEARFDLASGALEAGDTESARTWLRGVRDLLRIAQWDTEVEVGVRARIGAFLQRAGDTEAARKEIGDALALFDRQHDKIVNIERAGALRHIAEAWQALGDTAAALRTYRRALDEGVVNPNSRPRALDLSATCRSMAVAGVEPDAETWERMRAIRAGLAAPW